MGCDIHLFVEVKDANGAWQHVGFREFYTVKLGRELGSEAAADSVIRLSSHDVNYQADPKVWELNARLRWNQFYTGRNYHLFGVLADVRHKMPTIGGFTNHGYDRDRDTSVPPTKPLRGVPADASEFVRFYPHGGSKLTPEEWEHEYGVDNPAEQKLEDLSVASGGDWHSHHWLSLRELTEYDWDQSNGGDSGTVSEDEYVAWKEAGAKGSPKSYSASVAGGGVLNVTVEELDAIIAGTAPRVPHKTYYTQITWGQTVRDDCESFMTTIEDLKELAAHNSVDFDAVRIVFYFDN